MVSFSIHPVTDPIQGAHYRSAFYLESQQRSASGVQFGLKSTQATKVELCLFDQHGGEQHITIPWCDNHIWHVFVEGIQPGQHYGYRVHGPWNPAQGLRFNPAKLLFDPYAQKLAGQLQWSKELYDYEVGENGQWCHSRCDSAAYVPKSVVITHQFDWSNETRPNYKMAESVIYELSVRGFTMMHPDVPEPLKGTYLGMCQPEIMNYLKSLNITAVELLPITSQVTEQRLAKKGMKNYWGYNPLAFMAPEDSLAVNDPIVELKTMIKCFHEAGIEVIIDVVYNHTAESGTDGPLLSYRGIDNLSYYLVDNKAPVISINHSGCGNTIRAEHPMVIQLIMDSLRYWVEEYHIDGFRFDLAPILGRRHLSFDTYSALFQAVEQDPILKSVKIIAEPWDLAADGYQLGNFPDRWSEWNDRFRDCIRAFWRGEHGQLSQMTERLCGSADIFRQRGRKPSSSVNYICSHDGFTLHDLVSYREKKNAANDEKNQDGDSHNLSWNCGHEGETDDQEINLLRERYKRSLLATLLLSNGAVMLQAGDEFGNSQQGNNNAYCQDNEIGWLDWSWLSNEGEKSDRNKKFQQFTVSLIEARRKGERFGQDHFLKGIEEDHENYEVLWRNQSGQLMTVDEWANPSRQVVCLQWFNTQKTSCGCSYLILFNASLQQQDFTLPLTNTSKERQRYLVMNTATDGIFKKKQRLNNTDILVEQHSIVMLKEICTCCEKK
ncbi:MAG: glycogen debranching protein GlgX [Endozoicomonas sp. (ex Botrylloides leachii)]|nr:glycogen debranching protein GlgX [Endozoicomonas sp. (ex Botrylloides leachii)]